MENKNLFTELRFKKGNEVHDSGYACIEVVGFNKVIEEERLLTKCSDVIHLPQMYIADGLKMFGDMSQLVKNIVMQAVKTGKITGKKEVTIKYT